MLNRVLSRNLSPIRPPSLPSLAAKSTTSPFAENVSFILLEEMESSCVRSRKRCIMLRPLARLRGSPKVGIAAKGNRFHKTVGNKETAAALGRSIRQFYGPTSDNFLELA